MPKKTRKEKLLAQKHRRFAPSPYATNPVESGSSAHSPAAAFSLTLPALQSVSAKSIAFSGTDFEHMKKSLIKTVLLTLVILIGEFLLARTMAQ